MGLGRPLVSRALSSKSNGLLLSNFGIFNELLYSSTLNKGDKNKFTMSVQRRTYGGLKSVSEEHRSPNGATGNVPVIVEHNAMQDYLGLSEAWELIPKFDGDNPDEATKLIDACKNVKDKIDPAHEEDLLESILNTKIQGTAAIVLKRNGVTTFAELIVQLRKLYPREIQLPNSCFENCRYEGNSQYRQFSGNPAGNRFTGRSTGYSTGYFASFERAGHGEPCIHCGCRGHIKDYLFMWAERNHSSYSDYCFW